MRRFKHFEKIVVVVPEIQQQICESCCTFITAVRFLREEKAKLVADFVSSRNERIVVVDVLELARQRFFPCMGGPNFGDAFAGKEFDVEKITLRIQFRQLLADRQRK